MSLVWARCEHQYILSTQDIGPSRCIAVLPTTRGTASRRREVARVKAGLSVHPAYETSKRTYGSRPEDVLDPMSAGYQTERTREGSADGSTSAKMLKIEVTVTDLRLSKALRAMAVRRVLLSLSRFGDQVRKVKVRMSRPANPLGGVDQSCRMQASLGAGEGIRAEAINGRMDAAVARAATRLAKAVSWALGGAASDGPHAPLRAAVPMDVRPASRRAPSGPRLRPLTRARRGTR